MTSLCRILPIVMALLAAGFAAEACTSAIVGGKLTANGRPLLWKHRDTGHLDNCVDRVEPTDSTHAFIALFNASDSLRQEAWIGLNDAGFAVMNTASYNLAPDTASYRDREGFVMAEALRRCRLVDDFARLLDAMPKPLGVQANFGVIDSTGAGGYFETDDHGYVFYPLDQETPILVRTNFSVGGGEGGLGQVRYDNAVDLLKQHVDRGDISAEVLTEELSRSFYHAPSGSDLSLTGSRRLVDKDFIPRYSTSASVVVEGGDLMWVVMGYPPCSTVEAVTLDSVPSDLRGDSVSGRSPRCDAALKLKKRLFSKRRGSKQWIIDRAALKTVNDSCRFESLANYRRERQRLEAVKTKAKTKR